MIKIEFFRASKSNVKPGDKIIISGLFSASQEGNYIIKLHVIGTNVTKKTIKLEAETKEEFLQRDKSKKVTWGIELPDDFSTRFNFIGYLQWISKETEKVGILSSYLFTAGTTYDIEVIDHELIYNAAGQFKGLKLHAINREIESLNLKLPIIIKRRDKNLFKEVYETILNYEEIIEIDINKIIEPREDIILQFAILIDEKTVYKSDKIELFPDYEEKFVRYNIRIKDNIAKEEKNEVSIYLKDGEKINKRYMYFDLNIFVLNNEKWLIALNSSTIFGLNWEDNLTENPLIYDSFKDFLFSFIFFNIFSDSLTKEINIWKINKVLTVYLKEQITEDKNKKFKIELDKLNKICENIIELIDLAMTRKFISNNQYKNINIYRKNFYTKYVKIKEEIIGNTKKEKSNFIKAVEKIESEKSLFKKRFTEVFENLEDEMKSRNVIAATRKFLTYKINRDTNKAIVNKENWFKIMFKNEADLNSLPVKISIEENPNIKIIMPKKGEDHILILPETYSGWFEEKIGFTILKYTEDKIDINITLSIGV